MSQTAAHPVEHVTLQVPVGQRVLPLPIPLRLLLAAQPKLVQPVITGHLLDALALARRWNRASQYPTPADDSLRCSAALRHTRLAGGSWPAAADHLQRIFVFREHQAAEK